MSNKYSWSIVDDGTICSGTNVGSEYLMEDEIADRMNMMQDVIDWACKVAESKIETIGSGSSVYVDRASLMSLQDRLDRLVPPKTIDQLRKERDDAATHMSSAIANYFDTMSPQAKSALEGAKECNKQAKAAHEKAASEQS